MIALLAAEDTPALGRLYGRGTDVSRRRTSPILAAARLTGLLAIGALTACNEPRTPEVRVDHGARAPVVAVSSTPATKPNWDEHEDGVYFYIAALSDKDREEGKAAGEVVGFKYLGRQASGEHILGSVNNRNEVITRSYCREPCRIIKNSDGSRVAFSPESVIGSAFQDAIAGLLIVDATSERPVDQKGNKLSRTNLGSISSVDWNSLGMGCTCTFTKLASKTEILIAGGDDKVILRPDGEQRNCFAGGTVARDVRRACSTSMRRLRDKRRADRSVHAR